MLSIIIPTLNEEKYVGKLLGCLTKQTFKDFEVIVVDGNSDDRTREVVVNFKDKIAQLKLIKINKRNVSHQRNLGARHSKYDTLAFFDADIHFNNNFLAESLHEISNRKLSIASARIEPDLNYWYYRVFFSGINKVAQVLQYFSVGGFGACLFIDKGLFIRLKGFRGSYSFVEDHDLIQRASKFSSIRLLKTRFTHSVRRFEEYGTKKTMRKWGKGLLLFFLNKDKLKNTRY